MIWLTEMFAGVASRAIPWRLIGVGLIAVAAAGLYFYVGHLQSENERLSKDLAVAVDVANRNAQELLAMDEYHATAVAALSAERNAYAQRVQVLSNIQREIAHAPSTDDGIVAPVLLNTILSLQHAGDDHRGENRSNGGPRALARLPSDAPPPDT